MYKVVLQDGEKINETNSNITKELVKSKILNGSMPEIFINFATKDDENKSFLEGKKDSEKIKGSKFSYLNGFKKSFISKENDSIPNKGKLMNGRKKSDGIHIRFRFKTHLEKMENQSVKPDRQMQDTYQPKTMSSTPISMTGQPKTTTLTNLSLSTIIIPGHKDLQLPKNINADNIRHSKKTKVKHKKGLKKFKDLFEKILKLKEIFDTKNQKNINNEELDQLRETLHKIEYLKNIFETEMIKYKLNTERKKESKSKQTRQGNNSTESYQQQKSIIDQKTKHGSTERPRLVTQTIKFDNNPKENDRKSFFKLKKVGSDQPMPLFDKVPQVYVKRKKMDSERKSEGKCRLCLFVFLCFLLYLIFVIYQSIC